MCTPISKRGELLLDSNVDDKTTEQNTYFAIVWFPQQCCILEIVTKVTQVVGVTWMKLSNSEQV